MLKKKVTNIKTVKEANRNGNAASLKEIKAMAALEFRKNRLISKEEPADLHSGDMKKIICGDDDAKE